MEQKVAIITGSGQGLGKIFAQALAQEGAKIVVADINIDKGKEVVREMQENGFDAIALKVDVSDEQSVQQMVNDAVKQFGRIDVLVNNAAIFSSINMKPFYETDVQEWDQVMNVNLKGVFLVCKAVFPFMEANNYGKIVNISSGTVLTGGENYTHYVTSKAGVIGFTRSLARELGRFKINVNAILPTGTLTEIPRESFTEQKQKMLIERQCIKRGSKPEDLVGTLIFLCSEDSDFITGQSFNVDGGLNMH